MFELSYDKLIYLNHYIQRSEAIRMSIEALGGDRETAEFYRAKFIEDLMREDVTIKN